MIKAVKTGTITTAQKRLIELKELRLKKTLFACIGSVEYSKK